MVLESRWNMAWNKNNVIAIFILMITMDFSQITLIENCTSAIEILVKLDSIYEQKIEMNKMLVHERFPQYKMDINDTMAQYISKVENLTSKRN